MSLFKSVVGKARALIQGLVLGLVYVYRWVVSPIFGPCCRFSPTCSEYAIAAVKKRGIIPGIFLTLKRLLRCHPWHPGGYDPIPETKRD